MNKETELMMAIKEAVNEFSNRSKENNEWVGTMIKGKGQYYLRSLLVDTGIVDTADGFMVTDYKGEENKENKWKTNK